MNVLIIGGAGYIGSHICRSLKSAGHEVIVYDNLSSGHRKAIKDFPLIEGCFGDKEKIRDTLPSIDNDYCDACDIFCGGILIPSSFSTFYE